MQETDHEIIHTLLKPISYTPNNAGEPVEAQFITLTEPSVRNITACAMLKQAFVRVLAGQEQNDDVERGAKDDTTPMATSIINSLYASGAVDMGKVLLSAKELFKVVGLVDGEKKLTTPMLDSLSMQDLEGMTGAYMENFILASILAD